jgi:hypothetical protein
MRQLQGHAVARLSVLPITFGFIIKSPTFGCRRRAYRNKGQVSIKVAVLIRACRSNDLGCVHFTDSWIPGPLDAATLLHPCERAFRRASRWDSTAAGETLLLVVAEALVLFADVVATIIIRLYAVEKKSSVRYGTKKLKSALGVSSGFVIL